MTGYIVGYFEEWEFYMNPIVIGYYTTWNEALEAVKIAERINIDQRKGYCRVYLVEIENNKTCFPHFSGKLWIEAYDHYYIYTTNNKTILVSNKGNTIELELPETYNENDTSMPVWEKIKTLNPGQAYTLPIDQADPGFMEVNEASVAPQVSTKRKSSSSGGRIKITSSL